MDADINYYDRHLGDYAKDTTVLTMAQHGAYNLLLDRYYATEAGIPADEVYAVAKANTKAEKKDVNRVLKLMFKLVDGVWIKGRCEEVLAKYRDAEPERLAKKQHEAERQRKHREHRARLYAELKAVGQHPKWNMGMAELISLHQCCCNAPVTQPVTQPVTRSATASHSPFPIPHNQEEESETKNGLSGAREELGRFLGDVPRVIKESRR